MSKYDVEDAVLDEILVDNFAGGGGASEGISLGSGKEVDIAINHNAEALAMHTKNHPHTKHYCESVFDVDPIEATKGRPVGLVWLSPDCTHHSKAKGGVPRNQGIRGLAWIALRWLVLTKPRFLMLENVPELVSWGPLDDKGFPIKSRSGETFKAFVAALSCGITKGHPALDEIMSVLGEDFPIQHVLNGLGYRVEYRELRGCDYGAPTIRKRLFMIASRNNGSIVWPQTTHYDPKKKDLFTPGMKPWRTAAECIDWDEPTKSIFDRKKPLAINTLRRVAKGIKRYVLDSPTPFIVSLAHGEISPSGVKRWGSGIRDINLPLQTVLASGNGASIVQPFLAKFRGDSAGVSLTEPMPTITSGGNSKRQAGAPHSLGLVCPQMAPFLTEHANGSGQRNMAIDDPMRTICAQVKGGHFSVVTPVLTLAANNAHAAFDPTRPAPLAASGHSESWKAATMVQTGYGEKSGQEPRALDLNKPLGTVVAGGAKHALVTASMIPCIAVPAQDAGVGHRLQQLRAVHIEQANGGGYQGEGRSAESPFSTILGSGSHQQVVTSELSVATDKISEPAIDPRLAQVRAFAREFLGLEQLLVTIQGTVFEVVDICLRMLLPKELFKAQGFSDGYIFQFKRNGKPLSKSAQVRMCGNSVCPPVAEALVRANLGQRQSQQSRAA